MHSRGFRPKSRDRAARVRVGRRQGGMTRVVRWAAIDHGRTRVEYNAALRAEAQASVVAVERAMRPVQIGAVAVASVPVPDLVRTAARPQASEVIPPLPKSPEVLCPAAVQVPASPLPSPTSTPPVVRELSLTELFAQETGAPVAQPQADPDRARGR